jgi:hypothetical protein
MASEQKLVKVKVTNAVGIGYAKGKVYEVTPDEAAKLIKAQKATAYNDEDGEKATAKLAGKETR